jgi:hypothetical protein
MPPAAVTPLYTDVDALNGVLSADGVAFRITDTPGGTPATDLITQAANLATGTVNGFCLARYDAADLAQSWEVWDWTSTIAVEWLCERRGNPVPNGLRKRYERVVGEDGNSGILGAVRDGERLVGEIPQRLTSAPAVSNVIVDQNYRGKQIRVQRNQSDRVPRVLRQPAYDWVDLYIVEWP